MGKDTDARQSFVSPLRLSSGVGAAECGVFEKRCSLINEESSDVDDGDIACSLPPSSNRTTTRGLHLVHSSPQLVLNQIHEEREDQDGPPPGKMTPLGVAPRTLPPRRCNRRRVNPQRSCSSSDASDTDDNPPDIRRRQTPSCCKPSKPLRKDSSDHSSDNDGPPPYRLRPLADVDKKSNSETNSPVSKNSQGDVNSRNSNSSQEKDENNCSDRLAAMDLNSIIRDVDKSMIRVRSKEFTHLVSHFDNSNPSAKESRVTKQRKRSKSDKVMLAECAV